MGRESIPESVLSFTEMLLPVLLGLPESIDPAQGDAHLRKQCRRITRVAALLLDILPELKVLFPCEPGLLSTP